MNKLLQQLASNSNSMDRTVIFGACRELPSVFKHAAVQAEFVCVHRQVRKMVVLKLTIECCKVVHKQLSIVAIYNDVWLIL